MKRILPCAQLLVIVFMMTSCAHVYKPMASDKQPEPTVNFRIWLIEPVAGNYMPFASTPINYERVQADPIFQTEPFFLLRLEYRVHNNSEAKRIIEHWSHTGNLVKVQYQP